MLNESLSLLSLNELKDILFFELTILNVAYAYVLMYVVYKAFGRYIYFKPQEHASKVNRTFLTLSLFAIAIHSLSGLINYLPVSPEHRWFYIICGLVLVAAVPSILMYRWIWKYEGAGNKRSRDWHHYYLPISRDYYKTTVSKSRSEGNMRYSWEEEGVESTSKNIHSDALLNGLALITFIATIAYWTHDGIEIYGWYSFVFSAAVFLPVVATFFNEAIFSWIDYLQRKKWF